MNDTGPNKFVSSENTSVLRLLALFTVARWTEPRSIGRFISLGDDTHARTHATHTHTHTPHTATYQQLLRTQA